RFFYRSGAACADGKGAQAQASVTAANGPQTAPSALKGLPPRGVPPGSASPGGRFLGPGPSGGKVRVL
ncbi:MAG: hypothetical protein ACLQDQ_02200, partial [Myxococcaceae bacterium]